MKFRTVSWLLLVIAYGYGCYPADEVMDNMQSATGSENPEEEFPIDEQPLEEFCDATITEDGEVVRPLQDLEDLVDVDLKEALHRLVDGHTVLSYSKAREAIFIPANGGVDVFDDTVECIYTGRKATVTGKLRPGGFNTEHSWPQSKGATGVAKSDIHHLFPSDAKANSSRSSLPFGNTDCLIQDKKSCKWENGGSAIGFTPGTNKKVFQVRPERQGDIARAQFYFSIRYQKAISDTEEKVLREWHLADPPDSRECIRNNRIQKLQKNRNPFVDRPDFVEKILNF